MLVEGGSDDFMRLLVDGDEILQGIHLALRAALEDRLFDPRHPNAGGVQCAVERFCLNATTHRAVVLAAVTGRTRNTKACVVFSHGANVRALRLCTREYSALRWYLRDVRGVIYNLTEPP